ncbi:hypothetical protein IFO70_19920 [Phormidium tenue FACHB-886]|nr:hypothetical protein [Phormidium tenue FACHB-886]
MNLQKGLSTLYNPFAFFTHCIKANVFDDQDLIEILSNYLDYLRAKPVKIRTITILLSTGVTQARSPTSCKISIPRS